MTDTLPARPTFVVTITAQGEDGKQTTHTFNIAALDERIARHLAINELGRALGEHAKAGGRVPEVRIIAMSITEKKGD